MNYNLDSELDLHLLYHQKHFQGEWGRIVLEAAMVLCRRIWLRRADRFKIARRVDGAAQTIQPAELVIQRRIDHQSPPGVHRWGGNAIDAFESIEFSFGRLVALHTTQALRVRYVVSPTCSSSQETSLSLATPEVQGGHFGSLVL